MTSPRVLDTGSDRRFWYQDHVLGVIMNIEERLRRLEQQNRVLRLTVFPSFLCFLLFGGLAFVGQGQVRETVSAHRFELVNADGRKAGEWLTLGDMEPVLILHTGAGMRVSVLATDTQASLTLFSDGENLVRLEASSGLSDAGATLTAKGANGRATLGTAYTKDSRTGATTRHTASTLTLFDAEGTVLHQVPH